MKKKYILLPGIRKCKGPFLKNPRKEIDDSEGTELEVVEDPETVNISPRNKNDHPIHGYFKNKIESQTSSCVVKGCSTK